MRYCRSMACAIRDKDIDLPGLGRLEDRDAKAQLMNVRGIGPWTADIYLLMALRRPDIWPKGDLALEIAFQRLKGLTPGLKKYRRKLCRRPQCTGLSISGIFQAGPCRRR